MVRIESGLVCESISSSPMPQSPDQNAQSVSFSFKTLNSNKRTSV